MYSGMILPGDCFHNMKITKDTTLKEILEIKGVEEVLKKHNVPCIKCPFAKTEMEKLKLENICKTYNINLKELIKDLSVCE